MELAMNLADADHASYLNARDNSQKDLLIYSAKKSGRSPLRIHREFDRMAKSHSQLNMAEWSTLSRMTPSYVRSP
jgi:hypothetical protein